uniref:Envelope glycoprotein n=1 Tax=Rodentolepis nana TaxID=102285 RepID=A0A0R3TI38_RODNA
LKNLSMGMYSICSLRFQMSWSILIGAGRTYPWECAVDSHTLSMGMRSSFSDRINPWECAGASCGVRIKAFSLIREPIDVFPVTWSIASMGVGTSFVMLGCVPSRIDMRVTSVAVMSGSQLKVTSVAVMSGSQQ